jgi:hypothetical protein
VYEKNTHDLRKQGTSNPDTHKISELTQNENIDSPTDKAINKSTTKDADKYLEEKEALSTSVALMPEAKDIGYQDQLITEQLNNDKEYPKERTSKETSETKPKKGSFFNKLFKDRQENDLVNSNTNSQVGIRARKDKNKEETESKNESEEVVYLTDDDIDELLK